MIGFVFAGFLLGSSLTLLIVCVFASQAYDKGEIDGYEQGKRDGFRIGREMID